MRSDFLFTSESVSEGHPDKVSDQISDAIVDLLLSKDAEARIACETLTTTQRVVLAGEIRCRGVFEKGEWVDGAREEIERVVRETVRDITEELCYVDRPKAAAASRETDTTVREDERPRRAARASTPTASASSPAART